MAFRFRKSIRIAKGVRLNLSRSGVSTSLGGRGLTVNVSKRGTRVTTGIPGTGLSMSAGGSARGRTGGGSVGGADAGTGDDAAAGCMGCGCLGMLLVVVMGMCAAPDSTPRYTPSPPERTYTPRPSYPSSSAYETFHLHGAMNVRTGPGKEYERVRTLERGATVRLGPKNARGWATVFDGGGAPTGYLYRASDNVRSYPPGARREPAPTRRSVRAHPSGASAICRDGTYSYSAHRRGTCSHHGGVSQWL